MANNTQFYLTKKLYAEALTDVTFPISYDEWIALPEDYKVAALYVNFYPQITMAWLYCNKKGPAPITTEDAISAVVTKFVTVMSSVDIKKYKASWIYTVAKNAIYDEIKPKNVQYHYNMVCSNYVYGDESNEVEMDLFDLVPSEDDPYEVAQAREALWTIISGMGLKAEKVANHLINGDPLAKTRSDHKGYANDRLANVSVSSKEYDEILSDIKEKIAPLGYAFGF